MGGEVEKIEKTITRDDPVIPASVPYGWTWGIVIRIWPEIKRLAVIAVLGLAVAAMGYVIRAQHEEIRELNQQIVEMVLRR